jgi:hypothetical protein
MTNSQFDINAQKMLQRKNFRINSSQSLNNIIPKQFNPSPIQPFY